MDMEEIQSPGESPQGIPDAVQPQGSDEYDTPGRSSNDGNDEEPGKHFLRMSQGLLPPKGLFGKRGKNIRRLKTL